MSLSLNDSQRLHRNREARSYRTSPELHTPFTVSLCRSFQVTAGGSTLIVTPMGDLEDFRYQDVHNDIGRIHDLLMGPAFQDLIVDLQWRLFRGAVLTDAIVGFVRRTRGRAAICHLSDEMAVRIKDQRLDRLCPHFGSVELALAYCQAGRCRPAPHDDSLLAGESSS